MEIWFYRQPDIHILGAVSYDSAQHYLVVCVSREVVFGCVDYPYYGAYCYWVQTSE